MLEKHVVEFGQNTAGIAADGGDRAQHANEHGDDHGGAEPFAADISDDDKGLAVSERDDLEKVSANLRGGAVDAFDCVSGSRRQLLGNHDPLNFAGGCQFGFNRGFFSFDPDAATGLGNRDDDEAHVTEDDRNGYRHSVKGKPVMKAGELDGIELGKRGRVRQPAAEEIHANVLDNQ